MGKIICKNTSKILIGKNSQELLDHAKSATDALKTSSKRVIQKITEVTGDLASNKSAIDIYIYKKNIKLLMI